MSARCKTLFLAAVDLTAMSPNPQKVRQTNKRKQGFQNAPLGKQEKNVAKGIMLRKVRRLIRNRVSFEEPNVLKTFKYFFSLNGVLNVPKFMSIADCRNVHVDVILQD